MGLGKWIRYQYLTKLKKLTDAQMRIERFKQLGMKIGDGTDISIILFFEMLYLEMPCAKNTMFFLTESERNIYAI